MKFNWDNIVFQMLGKLVDCVWVSILWVICCIPVFTIGASTTALYYTVHKPSAVTADIPQEPFSERSGTTLRLQHCHILYGWPL